MQSYPTLMRSRTTYLALILAFLPLAGHALTVTNMDKVPRTISYEMTGQHQEVTLQPNQTWRLAGVPDGKLSLVTAHPKPNDGSIHADGLLSGIVGAERDQDIPTDDHDEYAIWPGGELMLQHRTQDDSRR